MLLNLLFGRGLVSHLSRGCLPVSLDYVKCRQHFRYEKLTNQPTENITSCTAKRCRLEIQIILPRNEKFCLIKWPVFHFERFSYAQLEKAREIESELYYYIKVIVIWLQKIVIATWYAGRIFINKVTFNN